MSTPLRATYPRRIGPAAMPTGTAASVYQAPERNSIQRFTFANTTAGSLVVTLNLVSATGTASAGNQIIPALTVPANDVVIVQCPTILNQGDRVFALATGAVNLLFNVNDKETEEL